MIKIFCFHNYKFIDFVNIWDKRKKNYFEYLEYKCSKCNKEKRIKND